MAVMRVSIRSNGAPTPEFRRTPEPGTDRCRPTRCRSARRSPVDDSTQVLGCLAVSRLAALGVVLHEHLGTVTLALRHHADVEAGVEQFAGRELAQGEDGAVEAQSPTSGLGRLAPLG